jgi:hypothetical protein
MASASGDATLEIVGFAEDTTRLYSRSFDEEGDGDNLKQNYAESKNKIWLPHWKMPT